MRGASVEHLPGLRITVSTLAEEETRTLADAIASAVRPAPGRSGVQAVPSHSRLPRDSDRA
ncbi:hypothetical protein [Streptomyces sp. P17]|uniref:hypothetical protein n=1 Tax=Streptomyces sp. P17 TaxID=3074716 RepID=UPI0028F411F0|nr:hypothetical protein [Streptomyces sp. P17]MDT9700422.1 hypothetical protein [Streptomyces sp. P17]